MIEGKCVDDVLTIYPGERVDSNNADTVGAEMLALREQYPEANIIVDAAELKYISSAGLRIMLKLRKSDPEMRIINVSSEVYEIFDMTGFSEMITVERALRKMSVDGCKVIGKGAKGTVYRYDNDTIIKVYEDKDSLPAIKRERELAKKAFVLGVPTAISFDIVDVDGKYGSVFELLDAKTMSQVIQENPDSLDENAKEFSRMLRIFHETIVKPDDMPDVKELIWKWVGVTESILEENDAAKLNRLIAEIPDTMNMLHCDYHLNNIMMLRDETLVIDMDTLSHGHKIFDLANAYVAFVGFSETDPKMTESFIGLPVDKCAEFWNKALRYYLETEDEETVKYAEDRIKFVSYVRILRHFLRRGYLADPEKQSIVKHYYDEMKVLLDELDSLDF